MRDWIRKQLYGLLQRGCATHSGDFGRLLVLAPHYDDEVLGCGGSVAANLAAGNPVTLVFMTSGGKSHRHLMAESELSRLRSREADAAATVLGVPANAVYKLDIEEGQLPAHSERAVSAVAELLLQGNIQSVMAPFCRDEHDDHEQTSQIARRAIHQAGSPAQLYEYPVWIWHHWPWCPFQLDSRSDIFRELSQSIGAGRRLLRAMDTRVDIRAWQALKTRALAEYRTQTTRVIDTPRWATLADVSGGEFMANLLRDSEYFSRVPRH